MTKLDEQRLIEALRRTKFSEFARAAFHIFAPGEELVWNWHLDAICHELERIHRGENRRLIIEVPPRSLKSFLVSVAFPAFCLGKNPASKIIAASYSMDLAAKLSNDCRFLMRSAWYRGLFPHVATFNKDTETEFTTSHEGVRYATSSGGTLTGRGGGLIILDDPQKAEDAQSDLKRASLQAWFRNTVYSRLNNRKNGAIILVMQRLHLDDLAGYLRETGGWHILSLPAIASEVQLVEVGSGQTYRREMGSLLHPERESRSELDDLRATMGSYHFEAQYLQRPIPIEGELVKWSWFRRYKVLPDRNYQIVQSWDIANKDADNHDYSVCTTWVVIGQDYYLLDLLRVKLLFPQLLAEVKQQAMRREHVTVLIEDTVAGTSLIQTLRQGRSKAISRLIDVTPKGDKITRLSIESAAIEAGHVWLPDEAPWLENLRAELAQFPRGRHDDQVDSITQFLGWARKSRSPSIGFARMI